MILLDSCATNDYHFSVPYCTYDVYDRRYFHYRHPLRRMNLGTEHLSSILTSGWSTTLSFSLFYGSLDYSGTYGDLLTFFEAPVLSFGRFIKIIPDCYNQSRYY